MSSLDGSLFEESCNDHLEVQNIFTFLFTTHKEFQNFSTLFFRMPYTFQLNTRCYCIKLLTGNRFFNEVGWTCISFCAIYNLMNNVFNVAVLLKLRIHSICFYFYVISRTTSVLFVMLLLFVCTGENIIKLMKGAYRMFTLIPLHHNIYADRKCIECAVGYMKNRQTLDNNIEKLTTKNIQLSDVHICTHIVLYTQFYWKEVTSQQRALLIKYGKATTTTKFTQFYNIYNLENFAFYSL